MGGWRSPRFPSGHLLLFAFLPPYVPLPQIMLAWHPQGDYLCALCRLHGRTKGTSLEVIHVRGSMPVYSVSLPTDAIACAWEV